MNRNQRGIKNPNYKHGHCINPKCIDCGKKIHPQATRCGLCEDKHHALLMSGKNNYAFGKKWSKKNKRDLSIKLGGTGIPHEKDKIKCPKCGAEIWRGSITCKNCLPKGKNHHNFGHIMKPKWDYYKNIWMRSSWEVAYAKYLDRNHIKWLYESKTFDLGNTTYTPDFYLPKTDTYIEIKGYKSDIFKKKFKTFKRKFKNIKTKLIDKEKLIHLNLINKRGDVIKEDN